MAYIHDTLQKPAHHKLTSFSGASFWYVCHANLGPDSSGTGFRRRLKHCSIPNQRLYIANNFFQLSEVNEIISAPCTDCTVHYYFCFSCTMYFLYDLYNNNTGVHVTEVMICHRLLFIFVISCKYGVKSLVVICLFTIIHRLRRFHPCLFSAPEIFIPVVYGTKNRRQKMESIYGADFWSVCRGYNSCDVTVDTGA